MAKAVLIVDDSALIRKQLGAIFDKAGYDIGFAKNGLEAVEFIQEFDFDLITMDINMPVMDGLTAVKEIMRIKPTPIIMVSSLTSEDADITFECLEAGAIDFVLKPGTITLKPEVTEKEILDKAKFALKIPKNRLVIRKQAVAKKTSLLKKQNNDSEVKTIETKANLVKIEKSYHFKKLVAIGSSTGGPGLIEEIVKALPDNYPYPVIVVQHMPDSFTASFAKRLDAYTKKNVRESVNGAGIYNTDIIIAKGGVHLIIGKKAGGGLMMKHIPKNHRFYTPSVDEMFLSLAKAFDPKQILAVELTGIGDDGAEGMLELRNRGAYTIAEDETTAVVYGMPKSCWENGAAMKKMPFPKIVKEIVKFGMED